MLVGQIKNGKIIFMAGGYYIQYKNGAIKNIFLYKFKRLENFVNSSMGVKDVDFDYDIIVFDQLSRCYLYFTYIYIDEPDEIF